MLSKAFPEPLGIVVWVKLNCSQRKVYCGILCCFLSYQVSKMYPFTWVFSIFPFGSQKWKQLVVFMLLHYFNFFFPSFTGLQVHPEAMTLISASWDGCMDHRQFGGLTSGYEVRIAHSFCIFKCINTCWLLLFSHLMSMQYLRRNHSQSQLTGKNYMSVLCFVWVFSAKPGQSMRV